MEAAGANSSSVSAASRSGRDKVAFTGEADHVLTSAGELGNRLFHSAFEFGLSVAAELIVAL